jgi:hypothetical protein
MTTEYLTKKLQESNGGFIAIALELKDPEKPGAPIASVFASTNMDYDTVTRVLDDVVEARKKVRSPKSKKKHGKG